MPTLDITLFGPPCAERDGIPVRFRRRQTLALLAYLAAADQPHGRDALAALFWPELDEVESHGALRRILYDLDQTIGKGWLALREGPVRLPTQPGLSVDVRRFHDLVAQAAMHGHRSRECCPDCLAALTEAAGLYRDDFLAGFTLRGSAEFDAWQTLTTESLRLQLTGVLEKLATALAARGELDLAVSHARRWLALDPLDEASHRLLMQLHAMAGDRGAAARQYEQCAGVLARELGVEPAPETTALYRDLMRGKAAGSAPVAGRIAVESPPVPAPAARLQPLPKLHNLPVDVTPFIGREAALAQVAELLADPACRVLTVLGPGGIGKTRLAIQAARGESKHFPHGVCFVDLAPIPSAELLSATILRALQVPQQAAVAPDQQLLDLLQDRQMLLVLDNYEHLLTGPEPERRDGYGLLTKLAETAPGLKLLVTSRARLNVAAEWLMPLEGLATPPEVEDLASLLRTAAEEVMEPDDATVPDSQSTNHQSTNYQSTLNHYSATRLFLACVCRLQPGFRPSADEAQAIAHICRLLEGVPLAIELAAAWTRILPLDEIARRLEQGLDLLTTTMRGVPERQRSMTATFDYSWRLLTPTERRILRQLSVFRGGFTLEAAQAVAGANLSDLANLVDASWLGPVTAERYTIHELIRQYCAEKLASEHPTEAGEPPDQVRRRHAAYFASLLASRWEQLFRRRGAFAELAPDFGNLLAAWDWALAADDLTLVHGLGNGLGLLADRYGQNPEIAHVLAIGIERLRAAQMAELGGRARWRERAIVLAMVLTNQSERFVRLGRLDQTEACLAEAAEWLAEAEPGDAKWIEAHWFYRRMAAWTRYYQGNFTGSLQMWNEVLTELQTGRLELWPYTADVSAIWLPETYWGRGFNVLALGDFAEARRLAEQALALSEQLGLGLGPGFASHLLAWAWLNLGDYERADQAARRFLGIASAFGEGLMTAMALAVLGRTQFRLGRYEEARAWWRRGLALARRTGLHGNVAACLVGLGDIELARGNLAAARRLYEQRLEMAGQPPPAGRPSAAASHSALAALIGLGRVALREGHPHEARERFQQVLSAAGCQAATTAEAIVCTAETLLQQGELARPAELCGFLLAWPGTPQHVRDETRMLLAALEGRLTSDELAAAIERGQVRRPEEVLAQIIHLCD